MKILIIICSIIVLVVILTNIMREEKYRKLYLDIKREKRKAEYKLEKIKNELNENYNTPIYNRNSYTTIRNIKNIMKEG